MARLSRRGEGEARAGGWTGPVLGTLEPSLRLSGGQRLTAMARAEMDLG